MEPVLDEFCLQRMIDAVEKVRQRHLRATAALSSAGIPYAVAGGQAVAWWVSTVDPAAVRNTRNTDLLIDRQSRPAVTEALTLAGFFASDCDPTKFTDGPDGKPRDAVRLLFAGEGFNQPHGEPSPRVSDSVSAGGFRVVALEPLVRMKLSAYRDVDRTHLRDMIEVGLIDQTWRPRFPTELAQRLQSLLDTPGR